jgi:hypothetical protein
MKENILFISGAVPDFEIDGCTILCTDLKDGPAAFGIIDDGDVTLRLFDFSSVYDSSN